MIYTQVLAKEKVVHFTLDGAARVNILELEVVLAKPLKLKKSISYAPSHRIKRTTSLQ